MNRIIPLSLMATVAIYAAELKLSPIDVQSTQITEVSQNAQVSADLADALSKSVPSIDMNRRSGIANDVFIRGQNRDNISVEVDGTKVCGACPNRMDPPVSHVLTNQIDSIEVTEGPYDVENLGTLSGGIKIKTKQPTEDLHGEVNFGFGSFNYKKVGATLSGGNDVIRVLISGSSESSEQYRDGNGDTLSQQVKNSAPAGNQYKSADEDMQAYKKNSIKTKAFINVTDDQELRLSYTANRSTNILYPNSPMDAKYDDSNIYSISYNIHNVADVYKDINLQYYYSDVVHPMSTEHRNSSNILANDTTNRMKSSMQGVKLKNSFEIDSYRLLVGLDGSKRTWKGSYLNTSTGAFKGTSLDDTETKNIALFATLENSYGNFDVKIGARYDSTDINPDGALKSNDYRGVNANIFTSYNLDKENKIFLGFGQASRVPDARELYFKKSGSVVGTPTLNQTTNREVDAGYEMNSESFMFKIKAFYSQLSDYIYIKKGATANAFSNIDATIYGTEISASYYATDDISVDMGASYKRGQKDEALVGQTDKDLADIAPLRGNIAVNYEYMNQSIATLEVQASDKWSSYDADNGEQELGSWAIVNFKVKHAINKNFDFTLGANNLFDKTYATSNTYADLTLVTVSGTTAVMLLNDPGRYIYTNLTFKF